VRFIRVAAYAHSLFISGALVLILSQKNIVATHVSDALLIRVWNYPSKICYVYFIVAMVFFRVIRFLQGCFSYANAISSLLRDFPFEKIQRFFASERTGGGIPILLKASHEKRWIKSKGFSQ
jgi:hypothetical protein